MYKTLPKNDISFFPHFPHFEIFAQIEMAQGREREVKMKKKSREFSRNENLAGL